MMWYGHVVVEQSCNGDELGLALKAFTHVF